MSDDPLPIQFQTRDPLGGIIIAWALSKEAALVWAADQHVAQRTQWAKDCKLDRVAILAGLTAKVFGSGREDVWMGLQDQAQKKTPKP